MQVHKHWITCWKVCVTRGHTITVMVKVQKTDEPTMCLVHNMAAERKAWTVHEQYVSNWCEIQDKWGGEMWWKNYEKMASLR